MAPTPRSIRFPRPLLDKLHAMAEEQDRSLNFVVVRTLEDTLSADDGAKPIKSTPKRYGNQTPAMKRQAALNKAKDEKR